MSQNQPPSKTKKRRPRHRANNNAIKNGRPDPQMVEWSNTPSAPNISPKHGSGITRVVHAEALGPSLPPLVITYTNEQRAIADWMRTHVLGDDDDNNKDDTTLPTSMKMKCLGLDTETKPSFTREAALAAKGPDVLQLAKADGNCLVIHLSQMERLQDLHSMLGCANLTDLDPTNKANNNDRLEGYIQLAAVMDSRQIAKAGVGIDQDALELFHNRLIGTNCRFDLRSIQEEVKAIEEEELTAPTNGEPKESSKNKKDKTPRIPEGLKGLTEYYVPGMTLPKKKKLQMSNWGAERLSDAQVGYAAGDAFAGAIAVQTIVNSKDNQHTMESFIETVMGKEVEISDLKQDIARKQQERKREREKRQREKKLQKKKGPKKKNAANNNNGGANNNKAAAQGGSEAPNRNGSGAAQSRKRNGTPNKKRSDTTPNRKRSATPNRGRNVNANQEVAESRVYKQLRAER